MGLAGALLLVRFAATAENVARARALVAERLGQTEQIPDDVIDSARLAVTEALANVVVHAYRGRDRPGEFEIELRASSKRLELVVRDDGCGPVPNPTSSGLGMGIPLMVSMTSSLEIRKAVRGTEVHMRFELPDCP